MTLLSPEMKWILSYMGRYKLMTTVTIVGSVIEIILFSLPTIYVIKIVDLFLNQSPLTLIIPWLIIMFGTTIIQVVTFYTIASVNEILAHRVTTDMTADLFNTLHSRPLYYHDQKRIGDFMARATGDTRMINIGLSPAFRVIFQIISGIIFISFVLLTINIEMTLILILSSPIYIYSILRYGKTLEPMSKEVQDIFGELSIHTAESLTGIRELKSYTSEPLVEEQFNNNSLLHASKVRRVGRIAAIYYPDLIMAATLGLTTIWGVWNIVQGNLNLTGLIAFVGLISFIIYISGRLQWVAESLAKANAAARRVREMLFEDITPFPEGSIEFTGKDTTLVFNDVSFSYGQNREKALDKISMTIHHGESVAIVGGPGSGKSTFIKLILRLYDPVKGNILLGGIPLSEYTDRSIRRHISSLEQEIFLFSNTVEENIAFGKPQVSREEIIDTAKIACAHDFIEDLEEGYATQIGERGVRLSGGQKQRIAIARALIMDPSILIMDDASAALDAETEAQIQLAIRNVLRTRTSIIITHRLSIISDVDRVLVFDKGKIVADGSHDELIRVSPIYRRLYERNYELPPLETESTVVQAI